MSRRSVVITGVGPVTAFGVGIDPLWSAMLEGQSAIGPITRFDPSGFDCKLGAELPDDAFKVRDVVPKSYRKATKVMCRDVELAVGAAAAVVADAGINTKAVDPEAPSTIDPARFGCHIGAGLIAADVDELTAALATSRDANGGVDLAHWGEQGMQNLTPLWLLKYLPNMLACHVTIVHDCRGPSNTITCCEASSALSLGESMRTIERGSAHACLTGGAEGKLNPMAFYRQQCAGRLARTENGDDASVVRPFDAAARGTVLGEGGGLLLVEDEEHARNRNARIYARISGFAASQMATPDTRGLEADPQDDSLASAVRNALLQANVHSEEIDAIVPFGSSIPHIDAAEARVIRDVFGERAKSIPLMTTIPFAGNCNAGNGAIALSVAVKAIEQQKLPARLHTTSADGLDAGAAPARDAALRNVLVMTTSQGGQNAVVVLSAP